MCEKCVSERTGWSGNASNAEKKDSAVSNKSSRGCVHSLADEFVWKVKG